MRFERILLWRRFISTLAYFSLQSVFFVYLSDKGFTQEVIAGGLSVSVFFSQAFAVFSGVWGDRYGYLRMVFLGSLFDVIGYLLLMNAHYDYTVLLASATFGIGSSLFSTNARAALLLLAGDQYQDKASSQGRFLQATSLASMFAPLLAVPFINSQKVQLLIWICCAVALLLCLMMGQMAWKVKSNHKLVKFQFSQLKVMLSKRFLLAHFVMFLPLGLASSFFLLFPYVFNNLLNTPEQIPIALFINGLLTVLVQPTMAKHINLNSRQLIVVSSLMALLLMMPWFLMLHHLSMTAVYLYLAVFTFA